MSRNRASEKCVLVLAAVCLATILAGPARSAQPEWQNVADGVGPDRPGGVLLWIAEAKKFLWVGPSDPERPQPCIREFEPPAGEWRDFGPPKPPGKAFHPYYQAVFDPASASVFCLSAENRLYRLNLNDKTWSPLPAAPELDGLSWPVMATDGAGTIVVVGADKKLDNLGWTRTAIYDVAGDKWSLLPLPADDAVRMHRQRVALKEALITLGGHIRLAWYQDPAGEGSPQERRALADECQTVAKMDQAGEPAKAELPAAGGLIERKQLLDALKAVRAMQEKVERADEADYPVPCSRRNSPLAYDASSKTYVLFGGDHEDYLMNDTWVLDLAKGWRRIEPKGAPSPRAGHALISLPGGGVALYEGYLQNTGIDYGSRSYTHVEPIQLWRYDVAAQRWDALGAWPAPKKETDGVPPLLGHFYDYSCQYYSPPALAAGPGGKLFLAAQPGRVWFLPHKKFPARVWTLDLGAAKPDPAVTEQLAAAPNQRLSRGKLFCADFCEVVDAPKPTGLDALPENVWVRLPDPPRNPLYGCRQRDWGTAVWDSDREQILHWGGGHCVRSPSTVAHYSPAGGRIVEGFDADEPYNTSGGGGYDSSILNRPWNGVHNYNHYCYDPKCKLLVSGRGYLYDPARMDWLRMERMALPYEFNWGSTVLEASPHGAVAWARKKNSDWAGLWIYDRQAGWSDLEPKGMDRLFPPYCDAHGMVYDSKRDRMILGGVGAKYATVGTGELLSFDFKTRRIEKITPANLPAGRARNFREMAYIDHADWVLIGSHLRVGNKEKGKPYTRVYDCSTNEYFLLDAGEAADGHSCGWMYDAKRKLALVISHRGQVWAMKINPATAKRLETAQ